MMVGAFIAACAIASIFFLALAARRFRHRRFVAGAGHGLCGVSLLLVAICAGLLLAGLIGYQRLTYEQPVMQVQLAQRGDRWYDARLTYPSGQTQLFELRGDEWQVDARVLKWRGFVNTLGFDSLYRLERISGRYHDIESESTAKRTVYALHPREQLDLWEIARRYSDWMPWADALYGSATYLPMADGAEYAVSMTQSGLLARAKNANAIEAIGRWQ